jgi:hypothetical protein
MRLPEEGQSALASSIANRARKNPAICGVKCLARQTKLTLSRSGFRGKYKILNQGHATCGRRGAKRTFAHTVGKCQNDNVDAALRPRVIG